MHTKKSIIIWVVVGAALVVPIVLAANSSLLQWREPIYIVAGFAGVVALALLLLQPLLASNFLPSISRKRSRYLHRIVGFMLVLLTVIHVVGLWITSPPDVIDALLFRSATPFSLWGVISMWALFATAVLLACRHRLCINPNAWRIAHKFLAAIIVTTAVVHAVLIDGTMEFTSKVVLCFLVIVATAFAVAKSKVL